MSCYSDEDLKPVEKRKKILEIIDCSVQGFLLVWIVTLIALYNTEHDWNVLISYTMIFNIIVMALIVCLSVRYIHKHSKQIEKLGIRTNFPIMTLYVVVWSGLAAS